MDNFYITQGLSVLHVFFHLSRAGRLPSLQFVWGVLYSMKWPSGIEPLKCLHSVGLRRGVRAGSRVRGSSGVMRGGGRSPQQPQQWRNRRQRQRLVFHVFALPFALQNFAILHAQPGALQSTHFLARILVQVYRSRTIQTRLNPNSSFSKNHRACVSYLFCVKPHA